MSNIRYRLAERDAFCRGCDKVLSRGEMLISMYSFRNRGQYIYLCEDCALKIQELIHNYNPLTEHGHEQ